MLCKDRQNLDGRLVQSFVVSSPTVVLMKHLARSVIYIL